MAQLVCFGDYSLDRVAGTLARDGEPVAVRRKVWDALCVLLEQPGILVPLDELRRRVWRDVQVSEGSVATLIYELRRTLDDSAAMPRFIETIPARGIRFIAPVRTRDSAGAADLFVGRTHELHQLEAVWTNVLRGERRLVVVAGEPGIGKSQLVRRFLDRTAAAGPDPVRILTAGCFESEGGAEAWQPVFDLLDAWHQADAGSSPAEASTLEALLRSHAPGWARQIPWVGGGGGATALSAAEARPGVMRREIASFFDAAAAARPLVLVFEDLHWADDATIDLVHHLATRSTRAPLLVFATYRPAEAVVATHPVARLRSAPRERLTVFDLQPLSRDEVRRCLGLFFADADEVVAVLLDETMRRSGGNPLFVLALAQLLVDRSIVTRGDTGWRLASGSALDAIGAPAAVETLLAQQFGLLTEKERLLLDAAAVAGEELDAAAVAGGLGEDVETVDAELRRIAAHASLLGEVGVSTWQDGTTAGRFRFRHGLYRDVLYRGIPAARRAKLHRRIGAAIERGCTTTTHAVGALLAQHFEAGGDHQRAADYLEVAALQMIERSAIREARDWYRRAVERVALLPAGPGRDAREIRVRTGLGLAAALTEGLEAPAIRENYAVVDRLRRNVADPDVLFPTLRVFWVFELLRFGYPAMLPLTAQLREVAEACGADARRSLAASMEGTTHCFLGNLAQARALLESSLALCDNPRRLPAPQAWLADPRVETRCVLAWTLWLSGEFARSREVLAQATQLAAAGGHESTRGLAIWFRSSLAQLDGDVSATRAAANDLQALAAESDLPVWLQIAALVRALADLTEGDPTALESGLRSLADSEDNPSVVIARAYLLGQLALAYGRRGQPVQGLALVDLALGRIATNQARVSEADLRRIRGVLLAAARDPAAGDEALLEAITVARSQGARTFELRAATERVYLHQEGDPRQLAAARQELATVCAGFPADVDALDLRTARALLGRSATRAKRR